MSIYYFSGVVGFLVCAGALPVVRQLALRLNLYDQPGPLKIHNGSIPRLGGIAMMAGLLATTIPFLPLTSRLNAIAVLVLIAIWAVGLIDDVTSLPSYVRFCVHVSAGAAFWLAGWHLNWFAQASLDFAATCVFVALVVNAMNLLDGMDGLAAGTSAIACLGFLIISAGNADTMEIVMASGLLGVSLGILTVNAPPATMFMGDSGSTLIGIVLAFLCLNWIHIRPAEHGIVAPLLFLTLPLADVVLAVLRRARSQAGLFDGDRRHFYDILLRRGWTVRRVLAVSLAITFVLVIAGWLCVHGIVGTPFAVGTIVSGVVLAAYVLGSLQPESKRVQDGHQRTSLGPALD
ncbi:MAG: glycosyl transferase, family 4 [Candidatus Acidoferrum typicum]|nr:glycosyl transferase, family 4 [Candidatus Acidoferrum typicum]